MKFSCSQKALANAVLSALRVAGSANVMPVLAGLLVEAGEPHGVRITGYNLDTAVRAIIPADIDEPGAVVVPGKPLAAIVRKLDEEVVVETKDNQIVLRSGEPEFTLRTMSAQEYPELPELDALGMTALPAGELEKIVRLVAPAAAKPGAETRAYLQGVLMSMDGGKNGNGVALTAVATDSFRMAVYETELAEASMMVGPGWSNIERGNEIGKISVIIPATALDEVARGLAGVSREQPILVKLNTTHALFGLPGREIVTRLLDGLYPSYEQVLAMVGDRVKVKCPRERLAQALDRMTAVKPATKGETPKARLTWAGRPLEAKGPELLALAAQFAELGGARDAVPAEVETDMSQFAGQPVELNTTCKVPYLLDVVKALDTPDVVLECGAPKSPVTITAEDVEGYRYLVMPVI